MGRVVGKAVAEGFLLDVHFTRSFYKHMLGVPVSYHDLEGSDPEFFKSLSLILTRSLEDLGMDGSLTFSADDHLFGQIQVTDLIVGGRDIIVTDANKHEYASLVAHHRMTASIKKQIDSYLAGFHQIIPPDVISMFDPQELELLISGLPEIDLDDLRRHTSYEGFTHSDATVINLWSVIGEFSKEEKALFVQFVTGTSKVPLDGFSALQVQVEHVLASFLPRLCAVFHFI